MNEIYYVDRPSIPPTSQVLIQLDAIFENAVDIDSAQIGDIYGGDAVEVRDSNGVVNGTLVYFPGITYAELIGGGDLDEKEVFEGEDVAGSPDDGVETLQESIDSWEANGPEVGNVGDALNSIREDRLLNLEIELSAAKQRVQDLEDEIADEEGALD